MTQNLQKQPEHLRFPEFQGSKAWEAKRLEDVVSFLKGKALSRGDIAEDGKYECIRYGELYTHYHEVINQVVSKTNLLPKDSITSLENDVLIPSSGETQADIAKASSVQKNGVILGGDLNILRGAKNGPFLSYYINGSLRTKIARMAQGISVAHLYSSQLKSLKISLPSPAEQKKIATCLTSLDEEITAHDIRLGELKDYKRGLMQQLFPDRGKTTPARRFREFQDKSPWQVKKMGEVFKLYQPETLSLAKLNQTGQYSVYGANGIIGRHDKYNHEDSEVIIACRGTCGEVHYTEPKAWITGNAMVAQPKDAKVSKRFTLYYLKNHGLKSVISGSAQPQITREGLAPLKIFLPSLSEQQRIADCLSSLDEAIAKQEQSMKTLKNHKNGLMKKLFPPVENTK